MSEIDRITKITDRAGTGAPNFTFGVNFAGSDSGINPHTHTEGSSEPGSPNNGDTWWDSGNDIYKVYMNNAWKDWLGTTPSPVWYGDRGIAMGGLNSGFSSVNTIQYWDMTSSGNASDFGDMTAVTGAGMGVSNGTRGVTGGGNGPTNKIEYITCATTGNGTDFGDLTESRAYGGGSSHGERGLFSGGENPTQSNVIDYITIANTGNATDFGDLGTGSRYASACADSTRAVHAIGNDTSNNNVVDMQYVTIANTGNATDFGDLVGYYGYTMRTAAASDTTRGLFAGGGAASTVNTISYITIQSTGNSTDFGDLLSGRAAPYGASGATYAAFSGGSADSWSMTNTIARVTIQTTGDATDHGDLTAAGGYGAGFSGAAS